MEVKGITQIETEKEFKGSVYIPKSKPSFNEWIDKIYLQVDRIMEERYGFNKPSTGEI